MALVKCPECGREISDKADMCVGCGAPYSRPLPILNGIYLTPARPTVVKYNQNTDDFRGTMALMVQLAARAVEKIGGTIEHADENTGLVTFRARHSGEAPKRVLSSLSIGGNRYTYTVNVMGEKISNWKIFRDKWEVEAQRQALNAIEVMKRLAK